MNTITMTQERILILALGNPLRGDDGVGSAVIEALLACRNIPSCVELVDAGTAGFKTLNLMDGYEHVIIIDAGEMGVEPGEWRRLGTDELLDRAEVEIRTSTLHDAGLVDALAIGKVMDRLPEDISIYLVQPNDINSHTGLSATVSQSVSSICEAILAEICGAT
jgi:hydrogenase maturation protease